MNTKIRTILAAATLAVIGFASTASAQIILSAGDVKFALTFYSEGTTPAGQAAGAQANPSVSGTGPVQYVGDNPAAKLEDTWGIFEVTSIVQGSGAGATKFTPGSAGYQLFGLFYGSIDQLQDLPTFNPVSGKFDQTFQAAGLQLDIYKVTSGAIFADSIVDSSISANKHFALNQYTGITTGGSSLFLSAAINNAGLSSIATYNDAAGTQLINSKSSGVLNTTYVNPALLAYTTNVSLNTLNFSVESQRSNDTQFLLTGTTSVIGNVGAVPEPSTYALFGVVGLMSIVAVRRFRASKKVAA